MKKLLLACCILFVCMESSFAEEVVHNITDITNEVTDQDIMVIVKALGCAVLCYIGVPMLFIGFFCAGIRAIRGFFNI